jgi:hypothetical protein
MKKSLRKKTTWTKETAPRNGRKPGALGRITILRKNAELIAAAKKINPKAVMLGFAGDETLPAELRLKAAADVAPYVHRRMPQVLEMRDLGDMTDEELRALIASADADPESGGSGEGGT